MPDHQAGPVAPTSSLPDGGSTPVAAGGPSLGSDWPDEVTHRIEAAVGTIRDKTTLPITKVARAIVFGLVVAVGGTIALVLAVIALVRLLDVYLPFDPYGRRVWVVYAGVGAIFLLAGAFCWSKRKPRQSS